MLVSTDEGVVYTLRYGGPIFAEGDELTARLGRRRREEGRAGKKDAAKKSERHPGEPLLDGDGLVRSVDDPQARVDGAEARRAAARGTGEHPRQAVSPRTPTTPSIVAEQKEAEEKAERDKADYEKKIADGQKKVEELADRFGPWYYVTPGDSFRSINLDRAAITQPKKPPGDPGGSVPDFHGGAGMPPGFPPMRRDLDRAVEQVNLAESIGVSW